MNKEEAMKNKTVLDDLILDTIENFRNKGVIESQMDVLAAIKYLGDSFTDAATDYEHFNNLVGETEKPPEKIKVTINPSKLGILTNEALVDEMGKQISRVIFSRIGSSNHKELVASFRTLETRFREMALNHEALCGEEPKVEEPKVEEPKVEEPIRMNVSYVHDANVEAMIIAQNRYGSTIRFTSTIGGTGYLEYVKSCDIETITKDWWPVPRKS